MLDIRSVVIVLGDALDRHSSAFLMRHEERLAKHPRRSQQVKNLVRRSDAKPLSIVDRAGAIRRGEFGHALD